MTAEAGVLDASAPAPPAVPAAPATRPAAQPALTSGALAGIGLFLAAVGLGLALAILGSPSPPSAVANPWPSLPAVATEPQGAAALVRAIVAGDATAVADALPAEQLDVLEAFLQPVVLIDGARYLGGVERNGEVIVGYVIEGRTELDEPAIVALTLRLREGTVVGIQ